MGTANVCGAGWVVPAKYYREGRQGRVCPEADRRRPLQAGLAGAGHAARFRGLRRLLRARCTSRSSRSSACPSRRRGSRCSSAARPTSSTSSPATWCRTRSRTPKLMLAPVVSGNWWLEFPGFQDPKSPFHDKRVREAISLAIDRDAMNQAECAGLGRVDGNWINDDVEYGIDWPKWEHDVAKAKQLMAEAGYPNGFNYRLADPGAALLLARRAHRLAAPGRSAFAARCRRWSAASIMKRRQGGLKEWPGVQHHPGRRPHRRELGQLVRVAVPLRRLPRRRRASASTTSTPSSTNT